MLNHVTYLYGFNLGFAERLVKDLSTEQMAAQRGGVINHPAWSLGHLVVSADRLGQLLGLQSNLPDGWGKPSRPAGSRRATRRPIRARKRSSEHSRSSTPGTLRQ